MQSTAFFSSLKVKAKRRAQRDDKLQVMNLVEQELKLRRRRLITTGALADTYNWLTLRQIAPTQSGWLVVQLASQPAGVSRASLYDWVARDYQEHWTHDSP